MASNEELEKWIEMDTEEVNDICDSVACRAHRRWRRDLYRHYWEPDKRHMGD